MSIDVIALADVLRHAAKAEILPRFRRLNHEDVRAKSEATDLVTEADIHAERVIRAGVEALAPEALFIGEESVAADPQLLSKLADAELAVVVDPVDGTFNFASGIPAFGVMASIVYRQETIAGIIYDPMGDDWVMAEKGGGAFLRRPDGDALKLSVAAAKPVPAMIGMASAGYFFGEEREKILANLAKVRMFASYRCSAQEYRTFAGGHVDFVLYNKLMPWDHLAGTLIAQEAGGYVRHFDASPYRPTDLDGGLLVATDADSWHSLRDALIG
ncbi:inositol monophosphatase family protein [Rhizobium sp. SSA_523]|uniref:inositol monophosphatase family protein n=1 Tax=Rhizobium sp. SSA_523 TaxID=2952477 RepID=UPI002091B5B6|nr:inositol monophosphatase family protein [Rhizobium sp. SSA_523]MCO5729973.1 inositol monophosphatase [Rhizobium sp. SSA_523]WKC25050.1 inositol monophosphatase family protein [Rhizobium sp. SSA_523]